LSEEIPAQLAGLRAGSLVAGYRLEAQVGAGGMAVVFRAHDERLGRPVALKMLAPGLTGDPAFRRRFIAESRAAALVEDPHIIPIYEAGEADGVLFIAMRFVRGGDLRLVLDREGALPPGRAAWFISPVASALDAAHGVGLVHRDVKPANVLVDARQNRPDHVYLSDFGVSKGAISSVSLTGAGQFLGTPDYSAPEQIQGQAVDGRTDQYALACVAYQLLTGALPFERDQGMAVLLAHLSQPPPSLSSLRPDLPGAADQVLAKGLAKVPEKRYGSCGEFADALREALGLARYSSGDFASASGHPETREPPSRSEFPASAGTGQAVVPADLGTAATIDSERGGGPAGQAISAAAAPASDANWWSASREMAGAPDSPTGERRRGDGPASTADTGDARLSGDNEDPNGAVPGSIEDSAAARWHRSVSNLMSRLARYVPFAAASENDTAIRAQRSHRAQPKRAQGSGRRWPVVATVLAVLVAVILGGGYIGWRWSQDQYYVGADSQGRVVVYRGVNQRIAGVSLSRPYQVTGIELAQVPVPYQQTIKATDAAGSLSDAQAIVTNVRNAVSGCLEQYTRLKDWVTAETSYLDAVTLAQRQHKPTAGIVNQAGQKPPDPSAMCPPSTAYGIPAAAIATPSAAPGQT
jgi:serine/threonine protein kinase